MKLIPISVELPDDEAMAYAQFLKRVFHSDYRAHARDEEEAYLAQAAGEKISDALARNGFAPR